MQETTKKQNFTIGYVLCILAKTKETEAKNYIRANLEEMISKYPGEKNILEFLIKEAFLGKNSTILETGVLAPDFTEENIISKVDDGHTILSWNNN